MTLKVSGLALAGALIASTSLACGFHNYAPRASLVQRLSDSATLALARPDPTNPFRYKIVQTLTGVVTTPEIPHLVDSATRRKLTVDQGHYVLFSQESATAAWERVAFVDDRVSGILDIVLPKLGDWSAGQNVERFRYFGALIEDPDMMIQRLALREVDQADYATLKSLGLRPDARWLLARMHTPSEADLLPIRIVLLGFTGSEEAADTVRLRIDSGAPVGNQMLGAYATAHIELGGAGAIRYLAATHLSDTTLPATSREMIVEAIAIHAQTGSPDVQQVAQSAIAEALARDNALAPAVARQFGARQQWSQLQPLTEALQTMAIKTPSDMIDVAKYVSDARKAQRTSTN